MTESPVDAPTTPAANPVATTRDANSPAHSSIGPSPKARHGPTPRNDSSPSWSAVPQSAPASKDTDAAPTTRARSATGDEHSAPPARKALANADSNDSQ